MSVYGKDFNNSSGIIADKLTVSSINLNITPLFSAYGCTQTLTANI